MGRRTTVTVGLLGALAGPAVGQDVEARHREACEAGELPSCSVLGLVYETGAGGVRDPGRALGLYGRACDGGVEAACARIDALRSRPPRPPADGSVRLGWVAEAEGGAPVAGALVRLPVLGLRAMSDEEGRVVLGRLPRGRHRIVTQRPGYVPVDGVLPVPWDADFLVLMEPGVLGDEPDGRRVFGRVTDGGGMEGLADVYVSVVSGGEGRTLTDPQGRFSLTGLDPGTLEVRFTRLGYATRTAVVTVEAARTVELRVSMAASPIELEPVRVTVGSPYLERSGFYDRAHSAWGTLFTRRDVVSIRPRVMSDLLVRAPGVAAERGPWGTYVVSRRRSGGSGQRSCRLRTYLDGMAMLDWDVEQVRPEDVEGIEIYRGPAAPIEYRRRMESDGTVLCGVVLIWTRRR